ncbi:hypothetical protein [Engelhardtia mirabilis]|uniref:Peptidase C-terminal archaeal/bacterial domain-containing protein n=1 Tax=Engelhardtia mirabilis TaxID=2528011 RepID=A0A518BP24_9BACT|nr:hypothetical protein Pla133_38320 [Planctomycetes bacterium Pla133]QDV03056.1 hypothetical protein Pla86_38310 [Planctomycetes bacterium Pla86]
MRPTSWLPLCLSILAAPALGAPHDGGGKPRPPVAITYELVAGSAGATTINYAIEPQRQATAIRAQIQLPHGGRVLEQSRAQTAWLDAGQSVTGWARVELPGGPGAKQVEIEANLVIATPDGGIPVAWSEFVTVGTGSLPIDAPLMQRAGVTTREVRARRTREDGDRRERILAPWSESSAPVVRGVFKYVDRDYNIDGWTGAEPERPIRLARLQLIDTASDQVLATGATAMDGSFELPLTGVGAADLLVRCDSVCETFEPALLEATDIDLVPYSVTSATFAGWDLGVELDVGTVVAQKSFSGTKQGSGFAQLDVIVDASLYLEHLGAAPAAAGMRSMWPGGTQSQASGNNVNLANGDGYDDSVLLHELGHVVGFLYSDTDHDGGGHFFGDSDQYPSLSMGEGYASFFGGAVRQFAGVEDPGIYADLKGGPSTGLSSVQLRLDFESGQPWASLIGGEADEVAVCCALWNLVDTAATTDGDTVDDDGIDGSFLFPGGLDGDALLWASYTGQTVLEAEQLNVLDVFEGLFADGHATEYDLLTQAFDEWKIRFYADASEPDGEPSQATPLALGSWTETHTLYASDQDPPVPGDGDEDHYSFWVEAQQLLEVRTRYPQGVADAETYCDPLLVLIGPDGQILELDADSGVGRNALIELATPVAGEYRVVVRSQSPHRRTGSYQLRARVTGAVQPPTLASIAPAAMVTLHDGSLDGITLAGSGLAAITEVKLGSTPIPTFWITGDDQISFLVPLLSELGTLDVVVSGPAGSAQIPIQVSAAPTPTILAGNGTLFWSLDSINVRAAAAPGETLVVVLALEQGVTHLPGLVEFAIGNGTVHPIWFTQLNAAGMAEMAFPLPPELGGGLDVWLQGAAVAPGGPLPLVASNVEPGKIF